MEAFRSLDYADPRLYKSGLFKEAIESHFWLLENSGRSLDSVYVEMHISIDRMMDNLVKNEERLNQVTDYLFNLLEKHSLFGALEYLALKVLNEVGCTVDDNSGTPTMYLLDSKREILLRPKLLQSDGCLGRLVPGSGQQVNLTCDCFIHKSDQSTLNIECKQMA